MKRVRRNKAKVSRYTFTLLGVGVMCVLCGELVMKVHWTDQKIHDKEVDPFVRVGESQRIRVRSRIQRAKFTTRILEYYGLRLSDWNGSRYVLSDKKGNTLVIKEAQKLVRTKMDPLDSALLKSIASMGEENNNGK